MLATGINLRFPTCKSYRYRCSKDMLGFHQDLWLLNANVPKIDFLSLMTSQREKNIYPSLDRDICSLN